MDLASPGVAQLLAELLAAGKTVRFSVTGASMRPFFAGGETVLVRRVLPAEIRRGDLLLCRQPGPAPHLLLHRVVRVRRRPGQPLLVQTHGDALWAPDPPVAEDAVLGRVCAVLPAEQAAGELSLDGRGRRIQACLIALRRTGLWYGRRAALALFRRLHLHLPHRRATSARKHH